MGEFSQSGAPIAIVRDRLMLFRLLLEPEIAFAEGYTSGRIEIAGDLTQWLESVYRSWNYRRAGVLGVLKSRWLDWTRANTLRGSRNNIHWHYDLGDDFYKLWLDGEMIYSCAYFPSPQDTLEFAQFAKMDYLCRKLRLRSGERVVEAGCGWGALALYMARHYKVTVKAFNISRDQIRYARARAREEGLADRVEFIEDDYRNMRDHADVFVSVGMLEHVGRKNYAELGAAMRRLIGDSGRGLLHFIGKSSPRPLSTWIRKRVFPGAYAPSLCEAASLLEPWDYAVLDVENLRLHYAKTLEHWLQRFEDCRREITAQYGIEFYRAWQLYLSGSIAAFRVGTLQLFQVLFAGRTCRSIPWTRQHLYETAHAPKEPAPWTPVMS